MNEIEVYNYITGMQETEYSGIEGSVSQTLINKYPGDE